MEQLLTLAELFGFDAHSQVSLMGPSVDGLPLVIVISERCLMVLLRPVNVAALNCENKWALLHWES